MIKPWDPSFDLPVSPLLNWFAYDPLLATITDLIAWGLLVNGVNGVELRIQRLCPCNMLGTL